MIDHEKSNEEFHLSQTPWGLVVHPGQKKPEGILKGPYLKSMPPLPQVTELELELVAGF